MRCYSKSWTVKQQKNGSKIQPEVRRKITFNTSTFMYSAKKKRGDARK